MSARFLRGALVASAAAGPILALPLFVGILVQGPPPGVESLLALPFFLLAATVIGAAASILPNMLCAGTLAWAGSLHPRYRHRALWTTTGAVVGGLIGVWWADPAGALGPAPILRTADLSFAALFAGDGAACALICRAFTRWDD